MKYLRNPDKINSEFFRVEYVVLPSEIDGIVFALIYDKENNIVSQGNVIVKNDRYEIGKQIALGRARQKIIKLFPF